MPAQIKRLDINKRPSGCAYDLKLSIGCFPPTVYFSLATLIEPKLTVRPNSDNHQRLRLDSAAVTPAHTSASCSQRPLAVRCRGSLAHVSPPISAILLFSRRRTCHHTVLRGSIGVQRVGQQISEPRAHKVKLWGLSYLYVSQDDLTDRGQAGRLSTSPSSDFVGKSEHSFAKSQPPDFGVGPAAQRFILHPRVKNGLSRK